MRKGTFVMERKTEPTCVRDMQWICRQRSSYETCVQYENGDQPKEGALSHTEIDVMPMSQYAGDKVKITQAKYYYDKPGEHGGWQLRGEFKTLETLTFEEFRQSRWWNEYSHRVSAYNCDSSWMDDTSTDVDEDGCVVQFKIPEYKSVWWCSADVPSGKVLPCEVCVSYDGTVCVTVDNKSVEFEASEVVEKIRKLEALERAGVCLDDDGNIVIQVKDKSD